MLKARWWSMVAGGFKQ